MIQAKPSECLYNMIMSLFISLVVYVYDYLLEILSILVIQAKPSKCLYNMIMSLFISLVVYVYFYLLEIFFNPCDPSQTF